MKKELRFASVWVRNAVLLLLVGGVLAACKKEKNDTMKEAVVTVTVTLPDGSPVATHPLLVFDEAGKLTLDQNPFAEPLAVLMTDEHGTAIYTLEPARWFTRRKERDVCFAVRVGVPGNYSLWSETRTVRPGDRMKLDFRVTGDPSDFSDPAAPGTPGGDDPSSAGGDDASSTGGDDSSTTGDDGGSDTGSDDTGTQQPSNPEEPTDPADPADPANPGTPAEGMLTGLSLRQAPTRTTYMLGEALDLSGLSVEGIYSDGAVRQLEIGPERVSGFSSEQAAEALPLTVEYDGHRVTFPVRVLPLRIEQGVLTEIQSVGGGELRLPDGVVAVADRAGMFCDAERIVFNDGLRSIGSMAFYGSAFTEVVLPASLEQLGSEAFYRCSALRRVDLSRTSLTTLPSGLFAYTPIEEVVWPAQLVGIESQAFLCTSRLTELQLPATVRNIGREAFRESALQRITLPNAIQQLGSRAFYQCSALREVNVAGAVPADPTGVVEASCFVHCPQLATLNLPQGVATVGRNLLSGNQQVRSIRIPAAVKRIEFGAFDNSAVREVTLDPTVPPVAETVSGQWYGFPSAVESIRVPAGSAEAYRLATGWSSFAAVIE